MSAIASIGRGDLGGLDRLSVDALALLFFEGRRQPLAVAGNADWRLAGRLARLFATGRFSGKEAEALLMPSLGRIGPERIFLLGLGPSRAVARIDLRRPVRVLWEAGVRTLGLAVPSSPAGGDQSVALAERFLLVARDVFSQIVLLEADAELSSGRSRLERVIRTAGLTFVGGLSDAEGVV